MQTPKRKRTASLDCTVSPYFSPSKRIKFDLSAELNETPLLNSIQQQPHRVKQLEKELFRLKPALIQESISHDPWRVLVSTTLLNKTTACVALPVFQKLVDRWPSPLCLSQASLLELTEMLKPLGTYNRRSARLIAMSLMYLRDPPSSGDPRRSRSTNYPRTPISHLPGAGPLFHRRSLHLFIAKR
ncbi:DNA glycosylase [Flagelloscypha sp. PMI_526]|nr:DNA glycosylase [Flagelloscypha sp. PMI_526]